jgi:2'-5' RNA ligase
LLSNPPKTGVRVTSGERRADFPVAAGHDLGEPDGMRLFVGLSLPDSTRSRLVAPVERTLARLPPRARRTDPRDWHLTLEFLGRSPPERLEALASALAVIDLGRRFELCTTGFGSFPRRQRARIIWLGVAGDGLAPLQRLQQRVAQACASVGHQPDPRPYAPHLTLARYDRGFDARELLASEAPPATVFSVESVVLFESVSGAVPRYQVRHTIALS